MIGNMRPERTAIARLSSDGVIARRRRWVSKKCIACEIKAQTRFSVSLDQYNMLVVQVKGTTVGHNIVELKLHHFSVAHLMLDARQIAQHDD